MEDRKVFIFGFSHIRSLLAANKSRIDNGNVPGPVHFDIKLLIKMKGDQEIGNIELEDAIERALLVNEYEYIVISVLGTANITFGLLEHEIPFDIHLPDIEHQVRGNDSYTIPYRLMWDLFENVFERNVIIGKLRSAGLNNIIHISSPPPNQDNQLIRDTTRRYAVRKNKEIEVADPVLRLKLWKLEMDVLKQLCLDNGMQFLPVPGESQTPEGYLKMEYYGRDATHANGQYGELVLRQLEKMMTNST